MDFADQTAAIAALAEPVRRSLFDFVIGAPEAVGREEAAAAVDVPVHTARFHLDKLVDEGLLDVEYRRLTGRSGPGAGRPAKLYRRSHRQFAVSIPERRYDLVGQILAAGVAAARSGTPLDAALQTSANGAGRAAGARSSSAGPEVDRLCRALADHGYQPRREPDAVRLANCPFDALARQHTTLICGLNRSFVQGLAEGLGCTSVRAELQPWPDHCCVAIRHADRTTPSEREE